MLLLRWSLSSLSQVEGWHAPAGRRTCEPRPLAQDGQIRPAAPVGAVNLGPGRRSASQDSPYGVSRIGGQAGTQAPDTTPVTSQNRGSRAGSTIHSLPAEYLQSGFRLAAASEALRLSGSVRATSEVCTAPAPSTGTSRHTSAPAPDPAALLLSSARWPDVLCGRPAEQQPGQAPHRRGWTRTLAARHDQNTTAAVSRVAATSVSFVLFLIYLIFLPFHVWALAVLIGAGALVATLIGRPGDAITAGITTAVVLVVAAVDPHDAWQQPVLRFADTVMGVAVGVVSARVGLRGDPPDNPAGPGTRRRAGRSRGPALCGRRRVRRSGQSPARCAEPGELQAKPRLPGSTRATTEPAGLPLRGRRV